MGKVLFDIERVRSILDAEDIDVLLTCRPENSVISAEQPAPWNPVWSAKFPGMPC